MITQEQAFRKEMALVVSKMVGHMAYAGMTGRLDEIGATEVEFDPTFGLEGDVRGLQLMISMYSGLEDGLEYAQLFLEVLQRYAGTALNIALALDTDGES